MLTQRLDFGLESIYHWRARDQERLPVGGKSAPRFEPSACELEKVIRRPTLDERLSNLLQPQHIDPDLLEPGILATTRQETCRLLDSAAVQASGNEKSLLEAAAKLLAEEVSLDDEVRAALAALLKG